MKTNLGGFLLLIALSTANASVLKLPDSMNGIWEISQKTLKSKSDLLIVDSGLKANSEKSLTKFFTVKQSVKVKEEIVGLHFFENIDGQIILVLRVNDGESFVRQYYALVSSKDQKLDFISTNYNSETKQIIASEKKEVILTLSKRSEL